MKQFFCIFFCFCIFQVKADTLTTKYSLALGAGISNLSYKEDISKHYNYSLNKNIYKLKNRNLYTIPISFIYHKTPRFSLTFNLAYSVKGHTIETIDAPMFFLNPIREDFNIYSIDNYFGLRFYPCVLSKIKPYIELNTGLQYNYKTTSVYYYFHFAPKKYMNNYYIGRKVQSINHLQLGLSYYFTKYIGIESLYSISIYSTGKSLPYKGNFQMCNNFILNMLFKLK
jgi:hypothetical protein